MKIAIIEDEQSHIDLLSGYLQAWGSKKQVRMGIISFTSAESFLFYWEEDKSFDVLFVDIQMEQMSGMDMARKIREKDSGIKIIFTTGISDYIGEGYEVEAMHYLIKPISEEKICQCMDKVMSRKKEEGFILASTRDGVSKFSLENINYIEARGHGCVIEVIVEDGERRHAEQIEVLEGISELRQSLGQERFVQCHRSYLCSLENIHHIDKAEKSIYFDTGTRIPVSRRLYKEVNQAFIRYFRKV